MIALVAFALLAPADGPAILTPQEVEARAVKARTDLKSAHVRLVKRVRRVTNAPKGLEKAVAGAPEREEKTAYEQEIYQSSAGVRTDSRALDGSTLTESGTQRLVVCRGCGPGGGYVELHHPITLVELRPKTGPAAAAAALDSLLSDARGLGYSYRGFVPGNDRVDSVVGCGRFRYTGVERVPFKGDDALLVRAEVVTAPGVRYACWVIPAKGYNVARVEMVQPAHPDKPSFAESELQLDKPSGVWYPKRVVGQSMLNGRLQHEEEVEVSVAEFNRVPDGVFNMAALDLPKNIEVLDHSTTRRWYWNGKALAAEPDLPKDDQQVVRPAVAPEPVEPLPGRSWGRWLAAAACVALAVAGVGAFRRAVFR